MIVMIENKDAPKKNGLKPKLNRVILFIFEGLID
jgi:hypothetical protein|tara:strand:+ start:81 stop:182 length:102 start_codon:yes stop_codon:yes gene_type:complete